MNLLDLEFLDARHCTACGAGKFILIDNQTTQPVPRAAFVKRSKTSLCPSRVPVRGTFNTVSTGACSVDGIGARGTFQCVAFILRRGAPWVGEHAVSSAFTARASPPHAWALLVYPSHSSTSNTPARKPFQRDAHLGGAVICLSRRHRGCTQLIENHNTVGLKLQAMRTSERSQTCTANSSLPCNQSAANSRARYCYLSFMF